MILLNRLEAFAKQRGFFSEIQFDFQEGVGCTEASFVISETINHMLERGSKVFSCFLDIRKTFDTMWIDGLLYKLFTELGAGGRMWLAIKDLYYLLTNWLAYLYGGIQSPRPDVMPDRREGITRAAGFVFACIDTQAS